MFPKQNFAVQITDKRLLNDKRGTIKRSAASRDYSLQKTDSCITIRPAEPLSFADYILGFLESKVDLTNVKSGKY